MKLKKKIKNGHLIIWKNIILLLSENRKNFGEYFWNNINKKIYDFLKYLKNNLKLFIFHIKDWKIV